MKLNEIALPTTGRTQGSYAQMVEPNALLQIKNLHARGGKNPNTAELVTLCRFLQTLKDGTFMKQTNPLESNMSTSKELLDHLRKMKPAELGTAAGQVYGLLQIKDADAVNALVNPTQTAVDWVNLFTAREAND